MADNPETAVTHAEAWPNSAWPVIVNGELQLAGIVWSDVRRALRQACYAAGRGEPVWIVGKDGQRIGAVVSAEGAAFLQEMRQSLREAERGETADLGSFAQYAEDED